ncbi:MAG: type II toxin-antitoxin system RelE/ParE family toxin [Gammaproteobacteria bacterium]|nr:type II toxin-antitoxin system RelE/ParE family toxin [Gammaproteobacteria bacterium]
MIPTQSGDCCKLDKRRQAVEFASGEASRWSGWVNGNWRLTFEFKNGHAYVLDYEDYH